MNECFHVVYFSNNYSETISNPLATARSRPPLSVGQLRIPKRLSTNSGVLRMKNVVDPPPSRLTPFSAPSDFKQAPTSANCIPPEQEKFLPPTANLYTDRKS